MRNYTMDEVEEVMGRGTREMAAASIRAAALNEAREKYLLAVYNAEKQYHRNLGVPLREAAALAYTTMRAQRNIL